MKVYVSELPKNCVNCDFGYANNFCEIDYELDLRKFDKNQKHPKCPLHSLSDYTKQARKEIVEFIDKCFEMQKYESIWINPDKTEFSCDVSYAYEWWESFRKILLDQIEGENND